VSIQKAMAASGKFADFVVERAEQSVLGEEIAVEDPEDDDGTVAQGQEFGVGLLGGALYP
jgi:hypothetical protein